MAVLQVIKFISLHLKNISVNAGNTFLVIFLQFILLIAIPPYRNGILDLQIRF